MRVDEVIQKLAGTYLKDGRWSAPAQVIDYDIPSRTCTVQTVGDNAEIEIAGVLLMPEVEDGLVVFPSKGSTVYIALSTRNDVFIEMFSKIDILQLSIPDGSGNWTKIYADKTGLYMQAPNGLIRFNDGSKGGIPINQTILNNLNKLINYFGHLLAETDTALQAASTASYVAGALQSSMAPFAGDLSMADMQNLKVKHGV